MHNFSLWSIAMMGFFLVMKDAYASNITDPYADFSTPLRETMRKMHQDVEIHVHILDFQREYMELKFRGFEKLTGAKILEVESTQASWFQDIEQDILGPGFIDLYTSFGNWIPHFAEMNGGTGLKDITQDINHVGLDWNDIMPAIRKASSPYKQRLYGIPLDGDVIIMLYRKDLVEDVGLPTPHTWDDVLTILEYYEGKDINGDGVPDFGNCFSTAQNDIGQTMFWSIASSFLQTKGSRQGTFFDAETFEPISSDPSFIKVLEVYQQLVQHSPFQEKNEGVNWQGTKDIFEAGRCVLWYNYPGPTRMLISSQSDNEMHGKLNIAPLPGMKCDPVDCNFSVDGANHAPFLASGGMVSLVNPRATAEKQAAALDFAFYLSDPAVSFWDVAYPGSFFDPLRSRHTASLNNPESQEAQAFLSFGWEQRQLSQLKETTEFNFNNENYVLDLRILGANEYQETGTMPHLTNMWKGHLTAEETAVAITGSWKRITDLYGKNNQRDMYREILGLPKYEESSVRLDIILSLSIVFGVIFVFLIMIVLKQFHTIRFKTRCVSAAPKVGTVAIIFTDIEGSTALWDISKSVMSRAINVHHQVIRSCIQKHNAYEVKTIGDAFMISAKSADVAVCIANDIQSELLNANWPVELASLPSACAAYFPGKSGSGEAPKAMFKGLRIRIGVHIGEHSDVEEGGEVQIIYDKVAKGYDYYGPLANAAARIESVAFGGQTIISQNVFENLSQQVKDECAICSIGKMSLKGVTERIFLYQCLPKDLEDRKFHGVCRRSSISDGELDSQNSAVPCSDYDTRVDVMGLTPIELRSGMARLQTKVISLQDELITLRERKTRPTRDMDNDIFCDNEREVEITP